MIIRDPQTGDGAQVNSEFELVTRSIIESELEHASIQGKAYSWSSGTRDIDAGDTMLFIKNTGDMPLVLDLLNLSGSNVICNWTVAIGSETTTPSGTTVTAVNMNRSFSATPADALAFYDETAVADGDTLSTVFTPVTETVIVPLDGIILGKNQYIQINQETESTSGAAHISGHFTNPS
jgi:hypothetical protein